MKICKYTCHRCFGEFWIRPPFNPKACPHCCVVIAATAEQDAQNRRVMMEEEQEWG